MSGVVHIDPAAITFPENFDTLLDICTTVNAQNVRTSAMDKVVAGSGVRRVSAIDVEDFLSLCIQLKEAGDAPNPPKFLTLAMEARGKGGSGAEVKARQKRAPCQSLVEYLWRCADHGSLQIGGGFLVLPGAGSAEEGAAGPSVPEKANSVASGASFTGAATRKRKLDELQDAVEELSERQSLAEGLGQSGAKPTEPTPKRPLTFVSIPNKVSPCLSCRSRVATIHYGPLISLGLILSKANLKFVSHVSSTRGITTSMTLRSTVGDRRSFLFLLFLYTLCRTHIPALGNRRSFLFLLFCTLSAEYTFRH